VESKVDVNVVNVKEKCLNWKIKESFLNITDGEIDRWKDRGNMFFHLHDFAKATKEPTDKYSYQNIDASWDFKCNFTYLILGNLREQNKTE